MLQKPDLAIFKNLSQSGDDWIVYHTSLGATKRLKLNSNVVPDSQTSQFNDTEPTSSLFTIGTYDNINKLNDNYISYLWADVPGLQKFGSYEGNNDSDGVFVELGFRPAILWVKNIDTTGSWYVLDDARDKFNNTFRTLNPNQSAQEDVVTGASGYCDFLSNGFKARISANSINGSYTYIYCAWAHQPMNNLFGGQSNAR